MEVVHCPDGLFSDLFVPNPPVEPSQWNNLSFNPVLSSAQIYLWVSKYCTKASKKYCTKTSEKCQKKIVDSSK